ncbi:uncharacterized protein LOC132795674 [Drosophila nasuta]|uniref:uncharacterized protein LOC132795674 n=1 Tax=Drosophila nasuta TaxID=42062 RepID=UPI00295ED8A8|nr:uncharacterized protein LOC132795674 [Drosophila nasuta]
MQLPRSQLHLLLLLLTAQQPSDTVAFGGIAQLEHVLHLILTRSCAAHNQSVYVSTGYREQLPKEQARLVDRVVDHVLRRHSQVPMLLDRHLKPQLNLHVQLMLFFVQSTEQFIHSAAGNSGATSTFKHKFLVVLLSRSDDESSKEEMSHLFSYMLHQRLNIDVLLLRWQLDAGSVESFTFWPYSEAGCESVEPILQPLRGARLEELYPQKVGNLYGCPLDVIVWHVPPYIELHLERGTELEQQLQGWDAKLLRLMAQRLNFRLRLVANEPPQLIGGESHMNGSFTGAFRMLRQRRANLTCGCAACLPARAKFLSHTVSYNQVEYVIVLRTGRAYSNYEIMLFPFACSTWLLLLSIAALHLLQRLFCPNWCLRLPSPIQLGIVMLLYVLRVSYESSIFEFVHNAPVRPLPQTVEQALQADYSFIVDHATHRMAAWLPNLNRRTHIRPGMAVDMFELLLKQEPLDGNWGVLSSRDFLDYYLAGHREQRHRFVVLHPKVMNNILCMHLPLGSYMASIISQLLFDLRSFGICQQVSQFVTPSVSRDHHQKDAFGESMRFLYAACYCLLFANTFALGVFALELLSLHSRFRWLSCFFERL